MKRCLAMLVALVALAPFSACVESTTFRGSAYFPGGPHGCYETCARIKMEMSAFVMTGQFATSCVCRVKRKDAPTAASPDQPAPSPGQSEASDADADDARAAEAGAHVALEVRRRQEDEAQRRTQRRTTFTPTPAPVYRQQQ